MGKPTADTAATFVVPKPVLSNPSATLLDLYDWNAVHNAEVPLMRYLDHGEVKSLTWSKVNDATRHAGSRFAPLANPNADKTRPVVAIFANTDPITYFCSVIGVLRAGYTVFPVSHRNSPEAVTHLLTRTGAQVLLTSADHGIQHVAQKAIEAMRANNEQLPAVHAMPMFEDLFIPERPSVVQSASSKAWKVEDIQFIMHSSGSTAFPKPIPWTAGFVMQWAITPTFGDVDTKGLVISCHALPMFHAMGVLQITSLTVSGSIMATFKPAHPVIFPTSDNVLEEAKATGSEMIITVPAFIEKWSLEEEKVAYLTSIQGVVFGGAPLMKEVGNQLSAAGVSLRILYGSTETGVMAPYISVDRGLDWQYMRFTEQNQPVLVPQEDGTFELIASARGSWKPAVINTKVEGRDAYATSDLFVPHPEQPGLWKIHGRADDQIMLSTGEKTNPGPIEKILGQDPCIQGAVVFGRGRTQNGVIIEPKAEHLFDVENEREREQFIEKLWPSVERANEFAPQHSRLYKEMIIVASSSKPFSYTGKGTVRRQAIINEYEQEINHLYDESASPAAMEVTPPASWSEVETTDFVRSVVHRALEQELEDGADIFQFGGDSLQATWIYNQIAAAMRHTDKNSSALPSTCVYEAPTISTLSETVYSLVKGEGVEAAGEEDAQARRLQSLLQKYTSNLPSRPTELITRTNEKDVVLVTGTTGTLGCNILNHLLADPSVSKVYAFNRSSATLEKQKRTFRSNGLDAACLDSPKLRMVCGSLDKPLFGLDVDTFKEIQDSVTHIIHNAWKVDFNQSVYSFQDLLDGLRALVDLALTSKYDPAPRILFESSVGVFKESNVPGAPAIEQQIEDPIGTLTPHGYPESKWLGERLLAAANEAGLKAVVVRVCQLCGGANGYWNEKEWFPSLVKSAQYVGCLPSVDGSVTWLPCDIAGLAITQMRNSNEPVLHLAHPRPAPWTSFIETIAKELKVPLVPFEQWLETLTLALGDGDSHDVDKMRENPALRLVDFYASARICPEREPLGIAYMDTSKSQKVAPALGLPELGADFAERWVKAWRAAGFINI